MLAYQERLVPALYGAWSGIVADEASIQAGEHVLDVGCGTGSLTAEAAARVGRSGRVVGLDVSDGMLAVARAGRPDIEWRRGDETHLPVDLGTFDVVMSNFALVFFRDPITALREMWRVLRSRGRLAVAVWGAIDRAPAYSVLSDIVARHVGETAAAPIRRQFLTGDVTTVEHMIEGAGIPHWWVVTRSGHANFASVDDFVNLEVDRWRTLARKVQGRKLRAVVAIAEHELAALRRADGGVSTPIEAHIVTATKE